MAPALAVAAAASCIAINGVAAFVSTVVSLANVPTTSFLHFKHPSDATSFYLQKPISFVTADVIDYGVMSDSSNSYVKVRDGGSYCYIGNRSLFFYNDGFVYKSGSGVGFYSNSLSGADSLSSPSKMYDVSQRDSGSLKAIIPLTTTEKALQESNSNNRYAAWTFTGCVPINRTYAVHMWDIVKAVGSDTSTAYRTWVEYIYDDDTEKLTVRRTNAGSIAKPPYLTFGSYGSVIVYDMVYYIAFDTAHTDSYSGTDAHIARVPLAHASDYSKFQYWKASTSSWSSTAPSSSSRHQSDAVTTIPKPSSGTLLYSPYHGAYLYIYMDSFADNKLNIISAPTPVGPWSSTSTLYTLPYSSSTKYSYAGQIVDAYFTSTYGHCLLVVYSYVVTTDSVSNYNGARAKTLRICL